MKALGYFGCDYNHPLITDIAETFQDNLQDMGEVDQVWLIGKLGDYYWQMFCDDAGSDASDELIARLYELPKNQVGSLLRAIINKSHCKPLTYWHCDHELPLIADVAETFGWNLEQLSEIDYYWLIARIGSYYWLHHCDGAPTEAAQEVVDRVECDELPQNQISCLIYAIANK